MSISSRFAVGIHILSLSEFNKDGVGSSEYLAESVNTNPTLIRKIIGILKKAGLVEVHPGIAGTKLAKKLSENKRVPRCSTVMLHCTGGP